MNLIKVYLTLKVIIKLVLAVNGNSFAKLWPRVGQCGFANVLSFTIILILNFLREGKVPVESRKLSCQDTLSKKQDLFCRQAGTVMESVACL
jgi:hypothetical protein